MNFQCVGGHVNCYSFGKHRQSLRLHVHLPRDLATHSQVYAQQKCVHLGIKSVWGNVHANGCPNIHS